MVALLPVSRPFRSLIRFNPHKRSSIPLFPEGSPLEEVHETPSQSVLSYSSVALLLRPRAGSEGKWSQKALCHLTEF